MANKRKIFLISLIFIICLCFFGCSSPKNNKVAASNPLQASKDEATIVLMSDTQFYSKSNPNIFYNMTQYLISNQKMLNLSYVVHTGDLVENFDNEEQWQVASNAMYTLSKIPHGVLAGNHDTAPLPNNRENFEKYFGENRFKNYKWYGEGNNGNSDHYDLVKVGKTDFIFVYLSDNPTQKNIDFANYAFQKYPQHIGVLCVHNYLNPKQKLSPVGKKLQNEIVAKNKNIYMVFCGHFFDTNCVPVQFDDDNDGQKDRTVYQIIANYQHITDGGYMLFIKINDSKKTVSAISYSPVLNDYLKDSQDITTNRFSFPIPWDT